MNLYLAGIIFLIVVGIKFYGKEFNKEYLYKENTTCINGIFLLFVFYRHINTYMPYQESKDFMMMYMNTWLVQFIVTTFLFYSGYGVFESIKAKKKKYIDSIPKNRILKTLLHFAIIVLVYALLNAILGSKNSIAEIIIAMTGWESIGNSNWYILGIILLYGSTYIAFSIFDKNNKKAVTLNWILVGIIIICLASFKGNNHSYYYDTLLCYPLGLTYSLLKEKIEKIMYDNKKYSMIFLVLTITLFALRRIINQNIFLYSLGSINFVLIIIMITMKFRINNPIIKWLGNNLFYLYILQRIPMIIFRHLGYASTHAYRFVIICIVSTIMLTLIFKKIIEIIDKIIFVSNKKKTT